jgi:hypothetical protein
MDAIYTPYHAGLPKSADSMTEFLLEQSGVPAQDLGHLLALSVYCGWSDGSQRTRDYVVTKARNLSPEAQAIWNALAIKKRGDFTFPPVWPNKGPSLE